MKRLLVSLLLLVAVFPGAAAPSLAVEPNPDCTITGTDGPDVINGTSGADVICGLGGDDLINGGNGDDVIFTGEGDDTVNAGAGNDTVYGDLGDDRLTGGPGADQLWGGDGSDALRGGTGNDAITGGAGPDSEYGDAGVDYCEQDPLDRVHSSCFRDNTAPRPIAAAFTQAKVYTQEASQEVLLRLRVKDFGTGVSRLQVTIAGGTYQFTSNAARNPCTPGEPAHHNSGCLRSGDFLHGVWEFSFELPRYLPARRFVLASVILSDGAGNDSYLEIQGALAVSFRSSGTGDSEAPRLGAVTALNSPSLDAQSMNEVPVTIAATDNLSGITDLNVSWAMAGCFKYSFGWLNKKVCQSASSANTMKFLGLASNGDGSFTGMLYADESMFNGRWIPEHITLVDAVGNRRELEGARAAQYLNALSFTVTNGKSFRLADAIDPVLQGVTLSPSRVDTASAPASVIVRLHVTDNAASVMCGHLQPRPTVWARWPSSHVRSSREPLRTESGPVGSHSRFTVPPAFGRYFSLCSILRTTRHSGRRPSPR